MAGAFSNYRAEPKHDPDSRYMPRGGLDPDPSPDDDHTHVLDRADNRELFVKLWTWWIEAQDAHFRSRAERLRDHEFYDGRQWTDDEIMELDARGQAPLVFNVIKQMVDWICGTERRTRVDWNVLPREESDVENASVKKELLKFVSDVNKTGWHRSAAFKDMVISGLGWIEDCVVNARNEEPNVSRHQDWKGMWWDPHSRDLQFKDARYLIRKKFLDLDYACAMFRDRVDILKSAAQSRLDPGLELIEDDAMLSSLYVGSRSILSGSVALILGTARQRVAIYEMWYRQPLAFKRLESCCGDDSDPLHGVDFDPTNEAHTAAANSNLFTLTEGVTDKMRLAFFVETGLLKVEDSPYKHGEFPFTPLWGFRDHLTGMPYGVVRPAIDPQCDYNKRRSKSLFLLSVNRVLYEAGSIDEADEDDMLAEAARPDGQVRLAKNALQENRFRIEPQLDMMSGHVRLMEEDKENIHESTGVTRENVGQESGAISGRAILAKQQQGAVTTAELFDNYRLGMQVSGEKNLANIEQFMTKPKVFRVLGPDGKARWERVNQPVWDPETESVRFNNDITQSNADFIVDQQDYRETMRMALAESMFELIGRLPPEVAVALLDIAVDLTDLPNKAALATRIRKLNGQPAPGTEDSPEAKDAQARQDAAKAADAEAARAAQGAKTRLDNAKADKTEVETQSTAVKGKREALDVAGMVSAVAPLAPAADRLWEGSRPQLQNPTPEVV